MKEIYLTQGKVALVDDSDFLAVNQFNWHAQKTGRMWYAARAIKRPDGSWTSQTLHHFLMPGVPKIDHKDGCGLDNRRDKLRVASHSQNLRGFQTKRVGCSSVYRGVCWNRRERKWTAQLYFHKKRKFLGYFVSEIDAARAYDTAARKYFGEFASPNLLDNQRNEPQ